MDPSPLRSTAIDYLGHIPSPDESNKETWLDSIRPVISTPQLRQREGSIRSRPLPAPVLNNVEDPEMRLPDIPSLIIVLVGAAMFQLSFFIVVSSASVYAEHLGGSATFSGLTIGIPTVFSGLVLLVMAKYAHGRYRGPLHISYAAMVLGNVLHALAYKANWLYLILIGRMVAGVGFTSFMFNRKYCSDPRIVGLRRRTTLAGWIVVGQAFGFSAGPFFGGLLYKIGFSNEIFNGYTSPGWIMACIWVAFWIVSAFLFKDVPDAQPTTHELTSRNDSSGTSTAVEEELSSSETVNDRNSPDYRLDARQWGVIICMCYYSMTCFFILGSWESNIPVYTAVALGYTPFSAGNFIALGGVTTFPFLFLNVWYARRVQDRVTLAIGAGLGLAGLLIMLALLHTDNVTFGPFYVCWFLVALGYNLASTCTLSLLSKQLPDAWNGRVSIAIQYSNYAGRVTGAILGGAGVKIGMMNYIGIQIAIVGLGGLMHLTLWREMKAKTG